MYRNAEFYSNLKQREVTDNDYESSFYLYKILKMQNLGDMNDLYNAQDVILLCEIGENRFQFMHDQSGFNPRKCNSAGTLRSCIEREMYQVIIALPTSNEIVVSFEQTITGGFSSVNTRLAFDTEIILPNLINKEETERSKSEKIEEITRYVIILGQIMKKNIKKKKSYNKDFKA